MTAQPRQTTISRRSPARLLSTTALTAASLLAFAASPALADAPPWTEWFDVNGHADFTFDEWNTFITQYSSVFIGSSGNLDIPEGYTVNITGGELFAARAANDADPTQILGNLFSDGRVVIIDANGVFFGSTSNVDVAGLVATTGDISNDQLLNNDFGAYTVENVGADADARIEMHGMINIRDAGLAAFVAPTVVNSGVITAPFGKVGFASGEVVTIDPYGDSLFEIEVPGNVAALLENTGTIAAEGGLVQMSAATAEGIVDNLINIEGVVTVASATQQGGRIILSAEGGTVNVAGTLDASGEGGGEVRVEGENVVLTESGRIFADGGQNGDGGSVYMLADNQAVLNGTIYARGGALGGNGGFVELSAMNDVSMAGFVNTSATNGAAGTFLIDPADLYIDSFWAALIAELLLFNNVDLEATNSITFTEDLDFSTGWFFGWHLTNNDLSLTAQIVNILGDVIFGGGNFNVYADTLNLNGRLYSRDTVFGPTSLMDGARYTTTAGLINVLSNSALIQQAVNFAQNGAVVNVANDVYTENLTVDKDITLNGNGATVNAAQAALALISILSDGVSIDGFNLNGGDLVSHIILSDGYDNLSVSDSVLHHAILSGITFANGTGASFEGNEIHDVKKGDGITIRSASDVNVFGNTIHDVAYNGIAVYDSERVWLGGYGAGQGNAISNARTGILLQNTNNSYVVNNAISNMVGGDTEGDGILLRTGQNITIDGNWVENVGDEGIFASGNVDGLRIVNNTIRNTGLNAGSSGNGIELFQTSGYAYIGNNDITNAGYYGIWIKEPNASGSFEVDGNTVINSDEGGILIEGGALRVDNNVVYGTNGNGIEIRNSNGVSVQGNSVGAPPTIFHALIDNIFGDGIVLLNSDNATVSGNVVKQVTGHGLYIDGSDNATVHDNAIKGTGLDGIALRNSQNADIRDNSVEITGGAGISVKGNNGHTVIESNYVRDTGSDGIIIFGTGSGLIAGNTVLDAGENGIFVQGGANFGLWWNTVIDAALDGIRALGVNGMGIMMNLVQGAGAHGISVDGASNFAVSFNTVENSGQSGINVSNASTVFVTGNTVTGNGDAGISVSAASDVLVGGNNASANVTGIRFDRVVDGELVQNTVNNNLVSGIEIAQSDAIDILLNQISDNGVYGLFASGGTNGLLTLSGNTFTNNQTGAYFQSGVIDISDLVNPNTFVGGDVALRFAPFDLGGTFAPMSLVGNTLGRTIFSGQSQFYVQLENGAFFAPGTPTIIDGSLASYDGIIPIDNVLFTDIEGNVFITQELRDLIESRLFDFDDVATLGQIFFGLVPGLDNVEDFLRQFGALSFDPAGLSVTVTGLPPVSLNAAQLAQIAPAAGGAGVESLANLEPAAGDEAGARQDAEDVAEIEPAAGGSEAACWGDAVNAVGTGAAVNYSFGGSFEESLADAATCETADL